MRIYAEALNRSGISLENQAITDATNADSWGKHCALSCALSSYAPAKQQSLRVTSASEPLPLVLDARTRTDTTDVDLLHLEIRTGILLNRNSHHVRRNALRQ